MTEEYGEKETIDIACNHTLQYVSFMCVIGREREKLAEREREIENDVSKIAHNPCVG